MFDIFDVLNLIGGLCLFLFGMNVMSEGLERRAGSSLKALLGKLTDSRLKSFLTGVGVTAVIQSSSATTVMAVGFVNSKIMTLRQSIGIIMGANIGTTVTAWILSLSGISSDNVIVRLLKPSSFTPILALIGIIFSFSKSSKKKDAGTILLGFSTLMFGMEAMTGAVSGLSEIPEFQNMFTAFSNPILGVIVGMLFTALIQSSSASVGILQALTATGAVSYAAAIPIIMGQNIGACIATVISSFGANRNAKRTALIHVSFNVIGTAIWLSVFSLVSAIFSPTILGKSATSLGIAVCHSAFNVLCTAIMLPASSLLERLVYRLVPESESESEEKKVDLDERLLATPAIALAQSEELARRMASDTVECFRLSLRAVSDGSAENAEKIRELEAAADHYEDVLGTFLARLSQSKMSDSDGARITMLLKAIGDFERISDHAVNVLESVEELEAKKIEFTDGARAELGTLCSAVDEMLSLTERAFLENDLEAAFRVEPLEEVVDGLKTALRNTHIVRLKGGECTVEAGFVWSDLLTDLERVGDHCSNIALGVIDASDKNMNAHEAEEHMIRESADFAQKYAEYAQKYKI